jgi:hypothetical protein
MFIAVAIGAAYGLSGFGATPLFPMDTVDPELTLIAPNGGEAWYIGDTNDILWTASDANLPEFPVDLWYSLNGGVDYTSLAEGISNSGAWPWAIPSVQSNNARVKVKVVDSFGNFSQASSAQPFFITYVPPAAPQNVNVDINNLVDAVISWDPVTQNIYGTPITPDGYIILYNETPYEQDQFYYFLGMSPGTSYTHQYVAMFRSQMFYRVVAYKLYTREAAEALAVLCAKAEAEPLPWNEAKLLWLEGGVK